MKKLFSVLCAILIASSMVVSAFAAAVESPAVEPPKATEVVVTDAEGNEIDLGIAPEEDVTAYVQLTSMDMVITEEEEGAQTSTISDAVKETLKEATAALEEMEDLGEVSEEYAGKEVLSVMNVQFSDDITEALAKGATVAVKTTLKMKTKAADTETNEPTRIPIIRYIDGKWVVSEDEYAEVLEDGTVVLYLKQAGNFTLVVDPEDEIVDEKDLVEETK